MATPKGEYSDALVAGPPSPENPCLPFPATTVNTPFGQILTTMLLDQSGAYTLPWASTATAPSSPKGGLNAGMLEVGKNQSVPATVVITCPWRGATYMPSASTHEKTIVFCIPNLTAIVTAGLVCPATCTDRKSTRLNSSHANLSY